MRIRTVSTIPHLLVGLACAALFGGVCLTENAFAQTPAKGLKPGQAAGTFAVAGKTVKLAHATAFVDQKDERKPVLLLLTEEDVPAAKWTSEFDLMEYRSDHHFGGVCFWLDKDRQVFRTDYYEPGNWMSTSASGIFELKIDSPPGKALSGSAESTEAAAKFSNPVTLDASFSATIK